MEFFHTYLSFTEMHHNDESSSRKDDFVFAREGEIYAVYLPDGGATDLNLTEYPYEFTVFWFNPRTGGELQTGTITRIHGGNNVSIGLPPAEQDKDWVALVRHTNGNSHE